jgi:quinol monooxygenase YgiN
MIPLYVTELYLVLKRSTEEQFLRCARLYLRATRAEPGNVRCELLFRSGKAPAFVLYEMFRDADAQHAHRRREHTLKFAAELRGFLAEPARVEHLTTVLKDSEPPPRSRSRRSGTEVTESRFPAGESSLPRIRMVAETLEFATATETALFGGKPDPCLLVGAYSLGDDVPAVVGRALLRARMTTDAPCVVPVMETLFDAPLSVPSFPATIGLLCVAVEENGGRDLRRIYQDLEDPGSLRIWLHEEGEPNPVTLRELCAGSDAAVAPRRSRSAELLMRDTLVSSSLHDDTWVGASIAVVEFTGVEEEASTRFRFAADAEKNDWVAVVRASLRSRDGHGR